MAIQAIRTGMGVEADYAYDNPDRSTVVRVAKRYSAIHRSIRNDIGQRAMLSATGMIAAAP